MNFKIEAKTTLNADEQSAMVEFYQIYDEHVQKLGSYIINAKEKARRDALIKLGWTPPEENGWRPIETAPKDGTWVLLASPSGYKAGTLRVEVCRYYPAYRPNDPWQNHSDDSFLDGGAAPTHWMPLPPCP